jgi:hypothetical protein
MLNIYINCSSLQILDLPSELITLLISEWLDVRSLITLDAAISSEATRLRWLSILSTIRHQKALESWGHTHESLQWMSTRHVGIKSITIKRFECIKENTFTGFKMQCLQRFGSSQYESYSDTSYHTIDACLQALSNGCPNLSSIRLGEFVNPTLESMDRLHEGCPLLKRIESGRAVASRREWHAPSDYRSRVFVRYTIITLLEKRRHIKIESCPGRDINVARRIENELYFRADNKEEYSDITTLKTRLKLLASHVMSNLSK